MKAVIPAWMVFMLVLITSCGSYEAENEESGGGESGKSYELKMKFRSGSAALPEAALPVRLYIFREDGSLQLTEEVASADATFKHTLPQGNYTMAAVAGLGEGYAYPSTPSLQDFITLTEQSLACSTALMTGRAQVSLKQSVTVTLTLGYAVSALSFSFTEVPDDATAVEVKLSPVSSGMSLGGSYRNDARTLSIACRLQGEEWKSDVCYAFPSESSSTHLSIHVARPSGSETYGYTWRKALAAGQPYTFAGSYKQGISIGGEFEVEGWKPSIRIEFDFEEEGSSPGGEDGVIKTDKMPQANTVWKGCYVWKVETLSATEANVTLLAPDQWKTLAADAEEHLRQYAIGELEDWRTLTADEAREFYRTATADFEGLNGLLATQGIEPLYRDKKERYLCEDATYTFCFYNDRVVAAGQKTIYYLRAVKTVRVKC